MSSLPFRTRTTSLSDGELILLDVLFDSGSTYRLLRRSRWHGQFNLSYDHGFDDAELRHRLRSLCDQGILEWERSHNQYCFRMTPLGGDLWSQERCPVWNRYCCERYREDSRGRTHMLVLAASPEIRDDFLNIWPMSPARRRTATFEDSGLIYWRPFAKIYAGVAFYLEDDDRRRRLHEHWKDIEPRRTWWRFVKELQRFVPSRPSV
jgi:hypothetical protein